MANVKTAKKFDFSALNVQSIASIKGYRRESGYYKSYSLVALHNKEIKSFAEIRCYATKATNYACFWIHSPVLGLYGQTGAKSSGYGYNREEAAISDAATKHGIAVNGYCDPVELLSELAKHLGLETFSVIDTYA